jgi:hypothetical protein
MSSSLQANPNLSNFHRLLAQVGTATHQVVSPEKPWCEIDGVVIQLDLLEWPSHHCILVTFTDKNFEIRDPDTLAYLLNLNRQIVKESPFCTMFSLDESGKHLQLHQRIQVDDLPVLAIERYFKETIERLQSMFIYVTE